MAANAGGDVVVATGLWERDGAEKTGRNSRVRAREMVRVAVAETGTCSCCSCSHGVADEFSTEKRVVRPLF